MGDISRIDLYHDLFFGCLIVFIVCAAIAVLLFFLLDIRKVIGDLSGRATKRQIQKVESENASTGRLRKKTNKSMENVDMQIQKDMGILNASIPGARKIEQPPVSQLNPPVITNATGYSAAGMTVQQQTESFSDGADGTSLLTNTDDARETELLRTPREESGTEVLKTDNEADQTALLKDQTEAIGTHTAATGNYDPDQHTFHIEREIILIHTEEVI